ncbi:M56 family metallopeptidase [Flavonifractor sp. An10]|uniref:M56 family metallopeptidase n=1 Tax=Flavonifractor sp. An10 TaxID=1965537 RepID=UPI000B367FF0|nr:M56 family metallopeptidase [Flavonifractor sp. An10]
MRDFLFSLFEVSLTMGAVTALLLALSPVWKRRFRPQWRYWAWLLVALRLAVPLNIPLPQAPVTLEAPAPVELSAAWVDEGAEGLQGVEFAARPAEDLPADRQTGTSQAEGAGASPAATGFSLTLAEAAFAVWLAGAAGVLAVQLARYAAFRRHTRRWSAPAGEYEGIPVQICALLSAPVLVGLARPRILLPEGLTGEKRAYALAHEAAHAKRRDLWYKALLLWVCALHWFNPLVWALRRSAERDVEICCDAAALAGRDEGWRQGYGAALLSFVSARPAAPLTSQFAGGVRGLKERFRALVTAAPARRGRLALALVLCAALLGGSLVACQPQEAPEETTPSTGTPLGEVTDPDELADGTYWATLPAMNWWAAGEDSPELSLILVELDPDTMTITGGYLEGGQAVTLPVAEDVELGNHGDNGLSNFLTWSMLSSYYPMVLEVEVTGGEITAMTWHDAKLSEGTPPVTAVEVAAVVHGVDPEAGTLTYAVDDGNVGADSQWLTASVPRSSAVNLELLQARVAPLSSWGFSCTLLVQADEQVVGLKAGPLYDGVYYIGRIGTVTATLEEDGSIAAFDACLYQMDQETQQFTRTTQEAEFRLAWLDDSGPEPRYRPYEDIALCSEDGTPYEGSVKDFLDQYTAEMDEAYPDILDIRQPTLQLTVELGVVTSMTRLPAP